MIRSAKTPHGVSWQTSKMRLETPQLPHPYAAPVGQSVHNGEGANVSGREDRPVALTVRECCQGSLPMAKCLLGKPASRG